VPRAPAAAPAKPAPAAKAEAPAPRAAPPAQGAAGASAARREAAQERAANDELIAGLFAGLGMAAPVPAERTPQRMRLIGELLRESIAGTLGLLAARTIAKRELGASATLLQTRGNNPLKFSPNVDAALTHLLGPPLRGFIGPRDAVQEAFGDLRAHQVAVLVGMRAALAAVLERFDPVALEARLTPRGMWDNLMPVNRRAKLWEQFGERYAEIQREVEDDFDRLFGRAFLQAYEAQLAELARAPNVDDDGPGQV
jgi:FHA domain-containing protein